MMKKLFSQLVFLGLLVLLALTPVASVSVSPISSTEEESEEVAAESATSEELNGRERWRAFQDKLRGPIQNRNSYLASTSLHHISRLFQLLRKRTEEKKKAVRAAEIPNISCLSGGVRSKCKPSVLPLSTDLAHGYVRERTKQYLQIDAAIQEMEAGKLESESTPAEP